MFDFALTEQGDILFEHNLNKSDGLKISFSLTNTKALKLSLKIEDYLPLQKPSEALKLSFEIETADAYDKIAILNETDSKIQALKIRLQTALGSLPVRTTIGSSLECYKHKTMNDKAVQNAIMECVKTAVKDIVTNPDVRVSPIAGTNGKEYIQKMIIYIYEDELLIYKYDLKG